MYVEGGAEWSEENFSQEMEGQIPLGWIDINSEIRELLIKYVLSASDSARIEVVKDSSASQRGDDDNGANDLACQLLACRAGRQCAKAHRQNSRGHHGHVKDLYHRQMQKYGDNDCGP